MLICRYGIFCTPRHIYIRITDRHISALFRLNKGHRICSALLFNIGNNITGIRVIYKVITVASVIAEQIYKIDICYSVMQNADLLSLDLYLFSIISIYPRNMMSQEGSSVDDPGRTICIIFFLFFIFCRGICFFFLFFLQRYTA